MGYADLKWGSGDQKLSEQKAWDDCGICIMTNSKVGLTTWAKVFHAITYLKGWISLPNIMGGGPFGKIPLCARGVKINERWGEWKGSWSDGEKKLALESIEGEPVLRFGENVIAKLVPAATPSIEYAEHGTSIDFVLEGLEMMVRLGWKDENRDIELWYDGLPPRILHLSRLD